MIRIRNGDFKLVIGFSASLAVLLLLVFDLLQPLELLSYDFRLRLRPEQKSHPSIALVEIAEDSIQALGRWPWARKNHGAFISVLTRSDVKAILYDILFSEPSDPADDEVLEAALKTSARVYLPYAFELEEKDRRQLYGKELRPLERFERWAAGLGHINIQPDSDGVIRRIPLVIEREGKLYPSIALEFVTREFGARFEDLRIAKGKWIEIPHPQKGMIRIPIDENYQMLINWVGRWKNTFRHYSFVEVIQAFKQKAAGVKPVVDLEELKNKFCFVGLTAIGLTDLKPNALEPVYPGVGVHATAVQNLLEETWIKPLGKMPNAVILLILSLVTSLGLLRRKPLSGAFFVVGLLGGWLTIAYFTLSLGNWWVSVVYPAGAVILNYLATTLYTQIHLAVERNRLFNLATRDGLTGLFNIRHFKLLLEAEFAKSREKGRPLSIIMSDIDHFKHFNDTYGHQVGDLVIREVAKIFRSSGRELDIPARYGGEELIMMLLNSGLEDAGKVAERIRRNVESLELKDEKNVYKVTISLGVSSLAGDLAMDDLIKRADGALYEAKEAGRNRVALARQF